MAALADDNRVLAVCKHCGSAYAAKILGDGKVRPIGRETCACGEAEFRIFK